MPWQVYEVRRVIWPGRTTPPARRTPPRSLHAVAVGDRAQMTAVLRKMAKAEGAGIQDEHGIERALAALETAWQAAASAADARPENQAGIRNGPRFRIPALRSAPFRGSGPLRLQGMRRGS